MTRMYDYTCLSFRFSRPSSTDQTPEGDDEVTQQNTAANFGGACADRPFSFMAFFSRNKSPNNDDSRSVASTAPSHHSARTDLKGCASTTNINNPIHKNNSGSQNHEDYHNEHAAFDGDDISACYNYSESDTGGREYEMSDSISSSVGTTSLHSNPSMSFSGLSTKPIAIDKQSSKHTAGAISQNGRTMSKFVNMSTTPEEGGISGLQAHLQQVSEASGSQNSNGFKIGALDLPGLFCCIFLI